MKRLLTYLSLALMLLTKVTEVFAGQAIADADGYWIVGTNSSGTWSDDKQYQLTDDSGTLSVTFANPYKTSGTRGSFVIATSRAFAPGSNTVSNWGNVIRPWAEDATSLSGDCGEFGGSNSFSPDLDAYDNIKVTVVRSSGTFTFEGVNNTTTATLTIGGTDITGTNSGSNYNFSIPAASYTAGTTMTFTLKTETGGTATYYTGDFTGTGTGDSFTYGTSSSSATMSYSVPSEATGAITVSLLTGSNQVVFAYQTSGGTSTGYYLVGDLNAFGRAYNDVDWGGKNWVNYGAINKVLKFKDNGNGTYSLRIPAAHPAENENEWDKPSKEKQDVSHEFVIAPESAFSGTEYSGDLYTVGDDNAWKTVWGLSLDWSKVLRPTSSSSNVLNKANASGNMAASGGTTNWEAKMNGGSYTITINPTANTWTVTNDNLTHVMYVITKQDGYWRASYLTDVTTGDDQAYDHNHGNNSGELSEFPNESGSTVYVAHNWYEHGSNKKFSTKEHLTIFGAWNTNGDLAPVTWINATSGATAVSIFPTAGRYSTAMDPTRGTTGDVTLNSQKIITNNNQPSIGNIVGAKGDAALISPDATLSPGTEDGNVDFKGSVSEDIAVDLTDGSDGIHTEATQYAIGFGADANFDLSETNKYTNTKFNLSFNGSTNEITYTSAGGNNYTGTVSGSSIYVKVRGFDISGNYGDIHTYKYTFHSKIGFEPHGGLFINSAKINITGGVAPYRYEIYHYSTKTENGETVIDYTTGTLRSSGTFSNTAYNADDDNFRISTPGFLKIIDRNGDEVSFEEVGGGFDFTYSTSENYKPYYSNTAGGYSTINADDAGAYPNGADYWKAAPGDLSYKLDPTWGGSSSISDERSEVLDWKGEATKHVNNGAGLSQTVTGLNMDGTKTYTVQAIVRGKGEKNKTVTLTLEGADIVTKTVNLRNSLGGKEDDADLSRNGSEVTRTGRVEYIEPMTFSSTGYGYATGDDNYKQAGTGWVKVEAKAKANDSGQLTIKIKGEEDADGWFNLSTVTLLEDANTTHGFRTTASATATEVGSESGKPYDYRARNIQSGWKQNNAYSFFDRGKNRNAVIFANNRTVIAMDKSLLAPECPNRDIDRRHPFNVVGSDEDDSTDGVAKALYLTDMGYGSDENNPVDYKIGTKGADGFNSSGYKDSGYTFMPIYDFHAENVILDRTPGVSEKEQTTIMLPFSITVDELKQYYGKEHLQVWDYTGFNLDTRKVRLTQVTDNLIANKPYMLTGANGTLDSRNVAAYRNKERIIAPVSYTLHHSSNTTDGGFSGTYEYITVSREDENKTETHYGFRATEGTFTIASESGAKLKPFRAYFTLPISYAELKAKLGIAESRTFSIVFDADATTGITQTEEVRLAPANVYNINGVLMNSVGNLEGLPKGIYIMNGKKFVVK